MHGRFTSFLRGIYFIRFPLALWFILLILGPLDYFTGAASFTRGILTPESLSQATTASFMVCSVGMIILLLVRIIAVNGQERFDPRCSDESGVPLATQDSWLHQHLGGLDLKPFLFIAAHIPGGILLFFVGLNLVREVAQGAGEAAKLLAMVPLGVFLAYIFWLFVGLIYYWTFDPLSLHPVPREVILPRGLIPLSNGAIKQIQRSPPPPISDWLQPFFRRIAHLGRGYASPQQPSHLYEGHRLAFISFLGLVVLYIFFFSFTAPVPIPYAAPITNAVAAIALVVLIVGSAFGTWPHRGVARRVKILCIVLLSLLLAVLIYIWIAHKAAPRGFSVLGSVLILITGIFWLLATLAFALDGTRLPIFSVSAVFFLLLKGCVPYPGEHHFTVEARNEPFTAAPTPSEVLDRRLAEVATNSTINYPPLIVVTAEGGGIHSAAWTANVLAELENAFRSEGARPFHSQILLASGVSGGSVGLLPFLREYTAPKNPFPVPGQAASVPDLVRARITLAANCSSLQAIAWGLSYYDIINFLSPFPVWPSSGIAALNNPPSGFDRSWALERSLNRNLSDKTCRDDSESLGVKDAGPDDAYRLTLHSSAELLKKGDIPAFTFNTTAAETGGRYLLSNYELQDEQLPFGIGTDILPAESFLHSFAHESGDNPGVRHFYADMPIATAARLSATFPYVSSASRIPKEISTYGFHFIDGGYYDNDGTASAMEFLYFALRHSKYLTKPAANSERRLPILLIEIRNDPDIPSNENRDSFAAQNNKKSAPAWGPDDQIVAPIEGFYQASHGSDTLRNRRELCVFETAFRDRLAIHHMVFDYRNPQDKNQPLSWDLTPNQQKNISCAVNPYTEQCPSYKEQRNQEPKSRTIHDLALKAAEWTKSAEHTKLADETCTTTGLGPIMASDN